MGIKSKLRSFFALDEEYEEEELDEWLRIPEEENDEKKQKVVRLKSVQQSSRVVLIEPRTYSEVQEIADQLKQRRAVVINLQRLTTEQARRLVDFMSGCVYAINGDIQKLGQDTFLCTPDNVDVSGMISQISENHFNRESR